MSELLEVHPQNPQSRRILRAVEALRQGAVLVYPTDSGYALGCHLGDKDAQDALRQVRHLDRDHPLSLVCRDLSELGLYARLDNPAFRLLKTLTPGPYTFILNASREVPRRLLEPKRRSIGLRVPGHPVCQALLEALGEPLLSASLYASDNLEEPWDGRSVSRHLGDQVAVVLDAGACGRENSTVLDLTEAEVQVVRRGAGPIDFLE